MSVRIRMKKMGRTHRPFFRICAIDKRSPRDGRALEELGTYDPNIADTDARTQLKNERIDYWLSVGAQPSEKVAVLIKKYGSNGTHADAQKNALERLAMAPEIPDPGAPASLPVDKEAEAKKAEEAAKAAAEAEAAAKAESAEGDAPAEAAADAGESKPEEAAETASEEKPAEEKPAE